MNPVHMPPNAHIAPSTPRFSYALRIGDESRTPEKEKSSDGTES